jgi:hypothetical protein
MKKATKKTAAGKRAAAGKKLSVNTRSSKKAKPAPAKKKKAPSKKKKSKVEQPFEADQLAGALEHATWSAADSSGTLVDDVGKANVASPMGDPYTDGDDADPATEDN